MPGITTAADVELAPAAWVGTAAPSGSCQGTSLDLSFATQGMGRMVPTQVRLGGDLFQNWIWCRDSSACLELMKHSPPNRSDPLQQDVGARVPQGSLSCGVSTSAGGYPSRATALGHSPGHALRRASPCPSTMQVPEEGSCRGHAEVNSGRVTI